jgi:phage shock protein PspC (stress-responsive transcriptional regulator)
MPGPRAGYDARRRQPQSKEVEMADMGAPVCRSHDRMIAGVCGGLAERLGWSPGRFRLAYVILSICSAAFPGILVYAVLWLVMPAPAPGAARHA